MSGPFGPSGAWNPAPCPAMLRRMQNRDRALQNIKRVESGKLGSDPGFSLFVEILARDAVRSLTTHEGAQPRTCTGPDASTVNKRPSPGSSPRAISQSPKESASSRPTKRTEGKAKLPAACQGRLFD